jgi:hypothetical protein
MAVLMIPSAFMKPSRPARIAELAVATSAPASLGSSATMLSW